MKATKNSILKMRHEPQTTKADDLMRDILRSVMHLVLAVGETAEWSTVKY